MSTSQDVTINLPDLLHSWPWPRQINPHYDVAREECIAWLNSLPFMNAHTRYVCDMTGIALLASLFYSRLDKDGCRMGCDLMAVFFIGEDQTDKLNAFEARRYADMVVDALRHPHRPRPTGEWSCVEITRQFWERLMDVATPTAQEHFMNTFVDHIDSVALEAADREGGHVRDLRSYFELRRRTIGIAPSLAFGRLYQDIPPDIINDPVIVKLTELATDMVLLVNDVFSYKKEWEGGDDAHNAITVVMKEFASDAQFACDWISKHLDALVEEFLKTWQQIPTYGGPIDREVRTYCDCIGNVVRGNEAWSMECERYFGKAGLEVSRTRTVRLSSIRRLEALSRVAGDDG